MKIAILAPVSLSVLDQRLSFDRELPSVRWGFPLGSALVMGLIKRGHHVSVISGNGPLKDMEVYRSPNCDVYLTPERKRTRWQFLTFFVKEVWWLKRAIEVAQPDVVFAHWTYFHAYAALTSGIPTLVVAHDSPWRIAIVNGGLQALIKAFYSQILVFPRIRSLTTVSQYIVEELKRFNHYRGDVTVIPNGIAQSNNLQRTPTRNNATTVAVVAGWGALKNVKTFFRAWGALKKRQPHWRAVVFGEGLSEDVAGMWLHRRGIARDSIELRGVTPRDQIEKFLREEADVFCSPTLEESFGMVFIEAMAQGVPCIGGAKSGAVPWVLGDGEAGLLTDVTEPKVLAADIERLMLDYELRKKLAEAGLRRVKECFDIEKVVDKYEEMLIKIAQEGT